MTFLAPAFLLAAGAAAAIVLGLHFLVTRPPVLFLLPTARFVPVANVTITTLARRPEDLLLLLLRVVALLLIGAAFAGPVLTAGRRTVARVVVADRSRTIASAGELDDSVRALLAPGDRLIIFDSLARPLPPDSLRGLGRSDGRGALSAALIAALRAGVDLGLRADSIELVLVSSFAGEIWDQATPAIRAQWLGGIRLVNLAPRADSTIGAGGVQLEAAPDDPLSVAVRAAGLARSTGGVRLVRSPTAPTDTAWVAGGGVWLRWPDDAPAGWRRRSPIDTVGAVIAGDDAVVAPFVRQWEADSATLAGARVVARWVDGSAAAVERRAGAGCVRDVAIPVPGRGDLVLRSEFGRLVRQLAAPCDAVPVLAPLSAERRTALSGTGGVVSQRALPRPDTPATPLAPWLLGAALLALLLEQWLRRRGPAQPVATRDAPVQGGAAA